MSKIVYYPAIFIDDPEEKAFNVTFPDVPEAITFGRTIPEAIEMAKEALGLALYNKVDLPASSSPNQLKEKEGMVFWLNLDLDEYRKKNHPKYVRKNTTIPEWLKEAAEKEDINFSQVLTEALKEKLGV
ncbi:HicB family protein [Listeria monocytogenes]|nr:HicB family protein [Listeria monocytogenes]EDN9846489.1 HicB family protein [Listeria monocytogenes]